MSRKMSICRFGELELFCAKRSMTAGMVSGESAFFGSGICSGIVFLKADPKSTKVGVFISVSRSLTDEHPLNQQCFLNAARRILRYWMFLTCFDSTRKEKHCLTYSTLIGRIVSGCPRVCPSSFRKFRYTFSLLSYCFLVSSEIERSSISLHNSQDQHLLSQ